MVLFFNSLEQVVLTSFSAVMALSLLDISLRIPMLTRSINTALVKSFSARLSSAVMVFLLVWKLSPVILRLPDILAHPILLIYAPGGPVGGLMAVILAVGYLLPILPGARRIWSDYSQGDWKTVLVGIAILLAFYILIRLLVGYGFSLWNSSRLNPAFF